MLIQFLKSLLGICNDPQLPVRHKSTATIKQPEVEVIEPQFGPDCKKGIIMITNNDPEEEGYGSYGIRNMVCGDANGPRMCYDVIPVQRRGLPPGHFSFHENLGGLKWIAYYQECQVCVDGTVIKDEHDQPLMLVSTRPNYPGIFIISFAEGVYFDRSMFSILPIDPITWKQVLMESGLYP